MVNQIINEASNGAIGIFDSGIGGLSIANCIHNMLPQESLIYVADSAFSPYGNLSPEQIIERVNNISAQLINKNVKAIVIACNTATVNAIDQLRATVNIPIIGVEPAIKPAVKLSENKSVGLLVTQATSTNPRFLDLVNQHSEGSNVHIQPCPELARTIEQGLMNTPACTSLLKKYLAPLIDKKIDTLVLGCTHYPLVSQQIKYLLGATVTLIETAEPVTKELIRQLEKRALLASHNTINANPTVSFYSTQPTPEQQQVMSQLWATSSTHQNTYEDSQAINLQALG